MRWQTTVSLAVIAAVAAETVPIVHDQDFEIFDTMSAAPKVRSFATAAELSTKLGAAVAAAAANAPADKPFTVAISGGSLPKLLAAGIVGTPLASSVDWSKWHVFFADERVVPLDDADSNYKACNERLFDAVGIPKTNVHAIDASLPTAEAVAAAYSKDLAAIFGGSISAKDPPVFDLVLLGMGPDGHTASLFPGHELLAVDDRLVAHIEDSPKLPPMRVTLTYPVINAAKRVFFVCTGAGKAPNLAKILVTKPDAADALPAARVAPVNGELVWFVDDAATAEYSGPKL